MNGKDAYELFDRVREIIERAGEEGLERSYRQLREVLSMACFAGVSDSRQAYGNLFSQVDYLCKRHRVGTEDKIAIQAMRRHTNHTDGLTPDDLRYDARALCLLVSAVFNVPIPSLLTHLVPTENRPHVPKSHIDLRYVRCIVHGWDDHYIQVEAEQATGRERYRADYSASVYLRDLLYEGMQLNLLDCSIGDDGYTMRPRLIVVEPDFLVDISSIAACFQPYGHHPLLYTVNRMKPRANTQATLLGNFAGSLLNDLIRHPDADASSLFNDSLRHFFAERALEFATCDAFDGPRFKDDAARQALNLHSVVCDLFATYNRGLAILEPSFVCESLGLQGRVDLMTTDMRLLVEQKSGRNVNIERGRPNEYGSFQLESHYVQLLLYDGVLRYNFNLSNGQADIRLLYSKYPPSQGLVVVAFYQKLFFEAIAFRNRLVAHEMQVTRKGFDPTLDQLTPTTLNTRNCDDSFYHHYLRPQLEAVTRPLHQLSPLERAYLSQMMTFVCREQRAAKMGTQEGVAGSQADLWNMPLSEKRETGSIYTGLTLANGEAVSGSTLVDLRVPDEGDDFLPNFRRGDMVFLYDYDPDGVPDVRHSILHRGVLEHVDTGRLRIALNEGLTATADTTFAIEHGVSDASASGSVRSLHEFVTAPQPRRDLLLGQRRPQSDASVGLTRHYHPDYDDVVLRAMQSRDWFLIVGPPGSGKTSMAMQFLVREELAADSCSQSSVLLMAYTNRAVDEICAMLADSGLDFLRLGTEHSCDARFRPYLLDGLLGDAPRLTDISARLRSQRIVVSTTSMLMVRPFIFDLKHFSLAIVDEASQILEPGLVGLLAAHRGGHCCIDRFVLVGDHKQLPAVVQQSEADSVVSEPLLRAIHLNDCRDSLFERLLRTCRQAGWSHATATLHTQGRMHPEVAAFASRKFYAREQLRCVPLPHQSETTAAHLYLHRRVVFVPSAFSLDGGSDKVNQSEARIVAHLLRGLFHHYGNRFDPQRTVGVIVPYRNQIATIRKELAKEPISALEDVSIDTVERYQGSQRDVIIYSFTVQRRYQLRFLTNNSFVEDGQVIDRKLNVAITRARRQLILVGNRPILSEVPLFRELMDEAETIEI